MLFIQQKNVSFFLFSLPLALCRSFSPWALLACRLLSLFLCLSLSLYSIYVDMTINLSLTLKTTRIQKQFPLSVFVFASQDEGGYAFSRQNNLELHLGSNTCWVSYFTFVCLWCRWTADGGRAYGQVITKISRMGRLPHFPRYGTTLARTWSFAMK